MVELEEVKSKGQLKEFIMLPFRIHKNHSGWLPPLISDEWKIFDSTKNHSFEHCDTILLLAKKEGKYVGRIMGIINYEYNKGHGENNGRFWATEVYEDKEVHDALLNRIESWAKEKGMDRIIGPIGFSDKDPQGYLIEGFDDPKTVMVTNHSFEYLVDFVESNGYTKKLDLFQYSTKIPDPTPEVYKRIAERVERKGIKILKFKNTKEVRPWVRPVFDLVNESYTEIYGFAPLHEDEIVEFSERFLPLLNAEYIKVAVDSNNEIVAFVVAMPDISKGLKKANGKLFPFGFIHILRALKKTNQLNLLLGAVRSNLRNSGIDAVLAVTMFESAIKNGLTRMDSHLIMETNKPMRAQMERMDHKIYKRYRIFEKNL